MVLSFHDIVFYSQMKYYSIKHFKGDGNNNNNNNKSEIINTAEYLSTKYKERQFVNIVKNHQSNMNSILKSAAKIIVELSQLNGKNYAKQDEMQHTKERLGEVLKPRTHYPHIT